MIKVGKNDDFAQTMKALRLMVTAIMLPSAVALLPIYKDARPSHPPICKCCGVIHCRRDTPCRRETP